MNHHGRWHADSTRGFFDKEHAEHPILTGVTDIWGDSDVYRTVRACMASSVLGGAYITTPAMYGALERQIDRFLDVLHLADFYFLF